MVLKIVIYVHGPGNILIGFLGQKVKGKVTSGRGITVESSPSSSIWLLFDM